MGQLIRPDTDWMDIVEAAYASARDDEAWGARLFDASMRIFGERHLCGAIAVKHDAEWTSATPLILTGVAVHAYGPAWAQVESLPPPLRAPYARALFYQRSFVSTRLEVVRQLPRDAQALLTTSHSEYGVADTVALSMQAGPGVPMVMFVAYDEAVRLSRHERRVLTQVAIHMEAALRLRLRPESVKAVISSDGRVLDHAPDAPERSLLTDHVKQVELARTRRRRREPESLAMWTALVDGHVSLVERTEGTKRHYLVLENATERQPLRALSRGELDVVSLAARGLSAKLVGYALGISQPTVSSRLASAASKIGLATRTELVRLAAILSSDPRAGFEQATLTSAELEVLELLEQGLSNRDIAAIRNRSVHTIANQVAQLLRKTGSPTRRSLATLTR